MPILFGSVHAWYYANINNVLSEPEKLPKIDQQENSPLQSRQASTKGERWTQGKQTSEASAPPSLSASCYSCKEMVWSCSNMISQKQFQLVSTLWLVQKNLMINIWRKADTLKEPMQMPRDAIRACTIEGDKEDYWETTGRQYEDCFTGRVSRLCMDNGRQTSECEDRARILFTEFAKRP